MMNLKIVLVALCFSTTAFAEQFCGRLSQIRADHDGYVTSLVFKSTSAKDDPQTAYNDKYMAVRNDNTSQANGIKTATVILKLIGKELGQKYREAVWDFRKTWALNVWVCLKDFTRSTRNNRGRVEQRANKTQSVVIKVDRKTLYKGDVPSAYQIISNLEAIEWREKKMATLEKEIKDLETTLSKSNSKQVKVLKKGLGL